MLLLCGPSYSTLWAAVLRFVDHRTSLWTIMLGYVNHHALLPTIMLRFVNYHTLLRTIKLRYIALLWTIILCFVNHRALLRNITLCFVHLTLRTIMLCFGPSSSALDHLALRLTSIGMKRNAVQFRVRLLPWPTGSIILSSMHSQPMHQCCLFLRVLK